MSNGIAIAETRHLDHTVPMPTTIWLRLAARSMALAAGAALSPGGAAAQQPEIVVAASLHRLEIERILAADHLDLSRMRPREVAEAMARIPKGRAPDDFWDRYQGHLRAWQWYAALAANPGVNGHDVLDAEAMVNATFDEVERIALRYGARLPEARDDEDRP